VCCFRINRVVHCAQLRGEHHHERRGNLPPDKTSPSFRMLAPAQYAPTMRRIAEALQDPKPYHLVTNNCQTFANARYGEEP
jgi:hypothetical protein